jgi:hypothetical protein
MAIAARAPILTAIALVACTTAASSAVTSPTPSPSARPTTFTSQTYGYSLTLPEGWIGVQASERWDGKGSPGSIDVVADQFSGFATAESWAFAAPTTKGLGPYARGTIEATLEDHGDTCPAGPVAEHPVEIGGQPGVLLEWDCGLLINQAIAVEKGVGYFFGLRDPSVHSATNPRDRKLFLGLLASVQFAD